MQVQVRVCDKCGEKEELTFPIELVRTTIVVEHGAEKPPIDIRMDLCELCRDGLVAYVESYREVTNISSSSHMKGRGIKTH